MNKFNNLTKIFIIITLIFSSQILFSQNNEKMPVNLGIYLGGNANFHNADFHLFNTYNQTGGISEGDITNPIPPYGSETSLGINGGFIINYPFDDIFTFSGRLGVHTAGVELSTSADETFFTEPSDPNLAITEYTDNVDASLLYGEVDLFLQFHNVIPVDNLYLLTGLEMGFPVTNEISRTETITRDQSTTTNENTFDIPDAAFRAALALGAGYVIELDENLFLTPEVSFRLPFTNVSSAAEASDWSFAQLRAGVSLTWGISEEEELPEDESYIRGGFKEIRAYDKDGMSYEVNKIKVEEVQYTELFPVLPYVFYNKNSEYPAASSQDLAAEKETGSFVMEDMEPDAVTINKKTLDIIGTRMQEYPNSEITIVGTKDSRSEKDSKNLDNKRAEQAKNYLVVNYGIAPDRIATEASGMPKKPSSQTTEDGRAENRRVEFYTDDPNLLKPVLIEKDRQSFATPDLVEFVPDIKNSDTLSHWQLELSQSGKMLETYTGNKEPNEIQWAIKPNQLQASELPVEYSFSVENNKGKSDNVTGTIPVEYVSTSLKSMEEKPDKTVSKFSLVVFDFDSPEISEHDKEIIDEHILPAIAYNSTIQIYGYTDRIGTEEHNKKLALDRANNVKEYLSAKAKDAKYEVYGIGESIHPFDNDLPIGRQLSRTVQVYVITPKE